MENPTSSLRTMATDFLPTKCVTLLLLMMFVTPSSPLLLPPRVMDPMHSRGPLQRLSDLGQQENRTNNNHVHNNASSQPNSTTESSSNIDYFNMDKDIDVNATSKFTSTEGRNSSDFAESSDPRKSNDTFLQRSVSNNNVSELKNSDERKSPKDESRSESKLERVDSSLIKKDESIPTKKPVSVAYKNMVNHKDGDTPAKALTLEQRIAAWIIEQRREENARVKESAKRLRNVDSDVSKKGKESVFADSSQVKDSEAANKVVNGHKTQTQKANAGASESVNEMLSVSTPKGGAQERPTEDKARYDNQAPKYKMSDDVSKTENKDGADGKSSSAKEKDEDKIYYYYYDSDQQQVNERISPGDETIAFEEDKKTSKEYLRERQSRKMSRQTEIVQEAGSFHTVENFIEQNPADPKNVLTRKKPKPSKVDSKDLDQEVSVSVFKARVGRDDTQTNTTDDKRTKIVTGGKNTEVNVDKNGDKARNGSPVSREDDERLKLSQVLSGQADAKVQRDESPSRNETLLGDSHPETARGANTHGAAADIREKTPERNVDKADNVSKNYEENDESRKMKQNLKQADEFKVSDQLPSAATKKQNIDTGSAKNTGTVSSTLSAKNTSTVSSTLGAKNTGTVSSTLSAKNTSTVSSTLSAKNTGTVSSTLSAKNTGTVSSTLSAKNTGTVSSTLSAKNTGTVSSTLSAKNTSTVSSTLSAKNTGTVSSTLSAKNTGTVSSTLSAKNNSNIKLHDGGLHTKSHYKVISADHDGRDVAHPEAYLAVWASNATKSTSQLKENTSTEPSPGPAAKISQTSPVNNDVTAKVGPLSASGQSLNLNNGTNKLNNEPLTTDTVRNPQLPDNIFSNNNNNNFSNSESFTRNSSSSFPYNNSSSFPYNSNYSVVAIPDSSSNSSDNTPERLEHTKHDKPRSMQGSVFVQSVVQVNASRESSTNNVRKESEVNNSADPQFILSSPRQINNDSNITASNPTLKAILTQTVSLKVPEAVTQTVNLRVSEAVKFSENNPPESRAKQLTQENINSTKINTANDLSQAPTVSLSKDKPSTKNVSSDQKDFKTKLVKAVPTLYRSRLDSVNISNSRQVPNTLDTKTNISSQSSLTNQNGAQEQNSSEVNLNVREVSVSHGSSDSISKDNTVNKGDNQTQETPTVSVGQSATRNITSTFIEQSKGHSTATPSEANKPKSYNSTAPARRDGATAKSFVQFQFDTPAKILNETANNQKNNIVSSKSVTTATDSRGVSSTPLPASNDSESGGSQRSQLHLQGKSSIDYVNVSVTSSRRGTDNKGVENPQIKALNSGSKDNVFQVRNSTSSIHDDLSSGISGNNSAALNTIRRLLSVTEAEPHASVKDKSSPRPPQQVNGSVPSNSTVPVVSTPVLKASNVTLNMSEQTNGKVLPNQQVVPDTAANRSKTVNNAKLSYTAGISSNRGQQVGDTKTSANVKTVHSSAEGRKSIESLNTQISKQNLQKSIGNSDGRIVVAANSTVKESGTIIKLVPRESTEKKTQGTNTGSVAELPGDAKLEVMANERVQQSRTEDKYLKIESVKDVEVNSSFINNDKEASNINRSDVSQSNTNKTYNESRNNENGTHKNTSTNRNATNASSTASNVSENKVQNTSNSTKKQADKKNTGNSKEEFLFTSDILKGHVSNNAHPVLEANIGNNKETTARETVSLRESDRPTSETNSSQVKPSNDQRYKNNGSHVPQEQELPEAGETAATETHPETRSLLSDVDAKGDDANDEDVKNSEEKSPFTGSSAGFEKIPEITPYKATQDFSLLKPSSDKMNMNKDKSKVKQDISAKNGHINSVSSDSMSANKDETRPACDELCMQGGVGASLPRAQAAVSAVLTTHFGPTKDQIIPFDLELLDLADNYDNTTGMFICTIPGTYVISLYLMSHPGAKVNARVLINNRPIAALWADDAKNAGFYPSSSTQTIAQLAFGDQVYVMLVDGGYGDSWVHANYNVFTIFLLYEQMF